MGSEKKALPTALNYEDRQVLKTEIKNEMQYYQEKVNQSPDLQN